MLEFYLSFSLDSWNTFKMIYVCCALLCCVFVVIWKRKKKDSKRFMDNQLMLCVAIKNLDELPGILTSIVGAFEAPHILTNMRKTLKLFSITSSCMESNSALRKSWINEKCTDSSWKP
jgi:hypothetical protein